MPFEVVFPVMERLMVYYKYFGLRSRILVYVDLLLEKG